MRSIEFRQGLGANANCEDKTSLYMGMMRDVRSSFDEKTDSVGRCRGPVSARSFGSLIGDSDTPERA